MYFALKPGAKNDFGVQKNHPGAYIHSKLVENIFIVEIFCKRPESNQS